MNIRQRPLTGGCLMKGGNKCFLPEGLHEWARLPDIEMKSIVILHLQGGEVPSER